MLSYHERRRLGALETWLLIDDPKFAEGLRSGDPQPPREYRFWRLRRRLDRPSRR